LTIKRISSEFHHNHRVHHSQNSARHLGYSLKRIHSPTGGPLTKKAMR